MKRIALVILASSLLCLGLTGLRVTLLERLSEPEPAVLPAAVPAAPVQLVAPRPVKDPQGPPAESTVEYVAGAHAARGNRTAGLLWLSAMGRTERPTQSTE